MTALCYGWGRKISLEVILHLRLEDQKILSDRVEEGIPSRGVICTKVLRHHLSMGQIASQKLGSWKIPWGQGDTRLERPVGDRQIEPQQLGGGIWASPMEQKT